jgi:nickel/cobalt exporter
VSFETAALLGVGLGVRHALEADHVSAVASLVTSAGEPADALTGEPPGGSLLPGGAAGSVGIRRAVQVSALWGLGHGAMLVGGGVLLVSLDFRLPAAIAVVIDLAVMVAMLMLGVVALAAARRSWARARGELHTAKTTPGRPLAVGLLHGASGTGAAVLLVASTSPAIFEGLAFLTLFAVASIATMTALAAASVWLLERLALDRCRLWALARATAGLASIGTGLALGWAALSNL